MCNHAPVVGFAIPVSALLASIGVGAATAAIANASIFAYYLGVATMIGVAVLFVTTAALAAFLWMYSAELLACAESSRCARDCGVEISNYGNAWRAARATIGVVGSSVATTLIVIWLPIVGAIDAWVLAGAAFVAMGATVTLAIYASKLGACLESCGS